MGSSGVVGEHGASMMMRVGDIATTTLSATEQVDLLFIFEEEKASMLAEQPFELIVID